MSARRSISTRATSPALTRAARTAGEPPAARSSSVEAGRPSARRWAWRERRFGERWSAGWSAVAGRATQARSDGAAAARRFSERIRTRPSARSCLSAEARPFRPARSASSGRRASPASRRAPQDLPRDTLRRRADGPGRRHVDRFGGREEARGNRGSEDFARRHEVIRGGAHENAHEALREKRRVVERRHDVALHRAFGCGRRVAARPRGRSRARFRTAPRRARRAPGVRRPPAPGRSAARGSGWEGEARRASDARPRLLVGRLVGRVLVGRDRAGKPRRRRRSASRRAPSASGASDRARDRASR